MSENSTKTREFLPHQFTDLEAVARHFEQKAAQGLMLVSMGGFACEYVECEPQSLRFEVVLCPAKGSDGSGINAACREFIDLCEEAGWRFIDHRGAEYAFCTADAGAAHIVTDGRERVEAVRTSGRRSRILQIPIALIMVLNCLSFFWQATEGESINIPWLAFCIFYAALVICYIAVLIRNAAEEGAWRKNALAAIERGEPIPAPQKGVLRRRKIVIIAFFCMLGALVLGLLAVSFGTMGAAGRSMLLSEAVLAAPLAILIRRLVLKKRAGGSIGWQTALLVVGSVISLFILFAVFGSLLHAFEIVAE